jgi:3-dehydroquinate synthetase
MIAAASISEKLVGFEDADVVGETVERMGLPVRVAGLEQERVMELLGRDKKRDADGLRMVLLEAIEHPVLAHVDQPDIEIGLRAIGF